MLGGGDIVICCVKYGIEDFVSYVSIGGGVLFEFLEGNIILFFKFLLIFCNVLRWCFVVDVLFLFEGKILLGVVVLLNVWLRISYFWDCNVISSLYLVYIWEFGFIVGKISY